MLLSTSAFPRLAGCWLAVLHMHEGKLANALGRASHQRRHLKRFPLPFCGDRKERGGARDLFSFLARSEFDEMEAHACATRTIPLRPFISRPLFLWASE